MTILLQWLVEHVWIFYALCVIGAIPFVVRALGAQRERRLSLFTLERETATSQVVQSLMMVFVFIAIGVAIFIGTRYVLPILSIDDPDDPLVTSTPSFGVEPPTPINTSIPIPSPSPTFGTLEQTVAVDTSVPVTPTEPTETPTLAPTDIPMQAVSGEVNVRFGDFAVLVGYGLPTAEVSVGQALPLTIYWRGLEGTSPLDYWVFTHLIAEDGRLIAQHDGAPVGGTRPISGWGNGETIVDLHAIVFQDIAYTGPARISIGLYDPAIGRVLTATGDDQVVLPVVVTIVP